MSDDMALVREFAASHSEPAFATLVQRHLGLVHSAALLQVGDAHLAEEIAQAVFLILARKAPSLGPKTILSAWLYRTTRYAAADALKANRRRQAREQEAYMQSTLNQPDADTWAQLAPLLDDAMAELGETDRAALVLRFFENKTVGEIAGALRMEEAAAQKRVGRALEKLRAYFFKRGIALPAAALTAAISANAVQAAPVGLALTISTAAALTGTTLATATTATAIKTIAMTTLQKTVITATLAVIAGVGIYEARQNSQLREQVKTLQHDHAPLLEQIQQWQRERDAATNQMASIAREGANTKVNDDELLRLRGKVGLSQQQVKEASDKARVAEKKLTALTSSQVQFAKHEAAKVDATKELSLALASYLLFNNKQYPTNIAQLVDSELRGNYTIGDIDLHSLEFINTGGQNREHRNTVEFRERLARQSPDGTWRRIYGFSDGSVHTATSRDGNFDAWEKENTYSTK